MIRRIFLLFLCMLILLCFLWLLAFFCIILYLLLLYLLWLLSFWVFLFLICFCWARFLLLMLILLIFFANFSYHNASNFIPVIKYSSNFETRGYKESISLEWPYFRSFNWTRLTWSNLIIKTNHMILELTNFPIRIRRQYEVKTCTSWNL